MSSRGEVYTRHPSPEAAHVHMQSLGMVPRVYRDRITGWSGPTHDGKVTELQGCWMTAVWPRRDGDRPLSGGQ